MVTAEGRPTDVCVAAADAPVPATDAPVHASAGAFAAAAAVGAAERMALHARGACRSMARKERVSSIFSRIYAIYHEAVALVASCVAPPDCGAVSLLTARRWRFRRRARGCCEMRLEACALVKVSWTSVRAQAKASAASGM